MYGFNANELVLLANLYGYNYRSINYVAQQAGVERVTALAWAEGRFAVTILLSGYHPRYFTKEPDKAVTALKSRKGKLRNHPAYLARITGEPEVTLRRWAKAGVFGVEDLGEGHIPRYLVNDENAIEKIEQQRRMTANSLYQVSLRTGKPVRSLLKLAEGGLFVVHDRGTQYSRGSLRYYVDSVDQAAKAVNGR